MGTGTGAMPSESRDSHGTTGAGGSPTPTPRERRELKSAEEIGNEVGVSAATITRVRDILQEGSQEQIESLRNKTMTWAWSSNDIRASAIWQAQEQARV